MDAEEFKSLLYIITSNAVDKIIEKTGWGEDEALENFTQSRLYELLENESTKVWHYSATMLSELFMDELAGSLVFTEGL